MPDPAQFRTGLAFGMVAYLWWGLIPIYFRQLARVNPGEILAHRIVWAVVLLAAGVVLTGGWRAVRAALASRKLVLTLLTSALLLAVNWLLYIHATVSGRVVDASLGYYMLPLVNAFLATMFLGETLRPVHYPALALVAIGVVAPAVWLGVVPWIAVTLAVSFGFYGLVRKMAPVDSFTGLTVETVLLLPAALGYLLYLDTTGRVKFGQDGVETGLLLLGGVMTVVPLLTFTLAIRRLPLLALNLIQVISPTMQLLVAVYWNHELVPPAMWAALGCVWAGVGIFIADAALRGRVGRRVTVPGPGAEVAAKV